MLEHTGEVAYFTSDFGERLRIYDCAFGPPVCRPHHRHVMPLESAQANCRYFVPEFGVARVYRFAKGESHELTTERLGQQLRGAGFVAGTGPNVGVDEAHVGGYGSSRFQYDTARSARSEISISVWTDLPVSAANAVAAANVRCTVRCSTSNQRGKSRS